MLVIGGGINGCAVAREAALHGLSVLLVERDALAAHTSSASSKLIHGGLRYLETYDFRLVREALQERARLLRLAPALVRPVPFVLPHVHATRPAWLVRLGLLLYDTIGGRGRGVPAARRLRASDAAFQAPFARTLPGFVYYDAMVDDAALTRAYAADAAAVGAQLREHVAVTEATRSEAWQVRLSSGQSITARIIVNAAGPWAADVTETLGGDRPALRLVKGSHLTVTRLYEGDHAYLLQQPDRRVVFAFPWAGETAIGTTDVPVDAPADPQISGEETAYLLDAANRYFAQALTPADVTGSWSGIRALHDDGAAEARTVTRDYHLELDRSAAPLLTIVGGKITTARALAEDVLAKLGWGTPVSRKRPLPSPLP
ncbi:homodimeric glycerol 3-phosphate dehydrogenase (quinone) [Sphingomonas guangdongensis]|uniref:Homodimeric glycerol 3-phosphate dehydrogenase (Quinone) n=2 Tax=Sphingomonas guangdongensis TaxID=1141890 RepID=A0A285QD71_9SPHN|nr:homodimeric glycerol 3-phosphate dehydrogenase (quinone) [Sphingomonas guangdongensis]